MARGSRNALIILDMLNTFDFPEAGQLLPPARKAARQIAALKDRAREHRVPVIYVNDNFGRWQSDWRKIFEACTAENQPGADIARILEPDDKDYFIIKPKHSGFYSTTLDLLLQEMNIRRLVITGIAGNICVLFTANDAHMRGYEIVVPSDCTASNRKSDTTYTLRQLNEVFGIKTPPGKSVRFP